MRRLPRNHDPHRNKGETSIGWRKFVGRWITTLHSGEPTKKSRLKSTYLPGKGWKIFYGDFRVFTGKYKACHKSWSQSFPLFTFKIDQERRCNSLHEECLGNDAHLRTIFSECKGNMAISIQVLNVWKISKACWLGVVLCTSQSNLLSFPWHPKHPPSTRRIFDWTYAQLELSDYWQMIPGDLDYILLRVSLSFKSRCNSIDLYPIVLSSLPCKP